MANTWFQFKKFTVHQQNSAMKVTTDGCLFGAIQPAFPHHGSGLQVLDIGTGTGLLSLMFAQLNPGSTISAIEIDHAAALEAAENVARSPFHKCIRVVQGDVARFFPGNGFGHIICNPPFYEAQLKSPGREKNIAHHSTELTLESLFVAIARFIVPQGSVSLLLPYYREKEAIERAMAHNLYPSRLVRVRQTPKHGPFRTIFFLKSNRAETEITEITIRDNENQYTPGFYALLKPFYLNL